MAQDFADILSVVIIARNEEDRIKSCLDSIFAMSCDVPCEVILVDSNSSDQTTEIASQYPIDIYQIGKENPVSPAIGRAIGARISRGKYILFLDGDTRLAPNWLNHALELFRKHPNVGGVTGHVNSTKDTDNNSVNPIDRESVAAFEGHGLFAARAYFEAGGFDPSIRGSEDYELCYRISRSGYELSRLPLVSIYADPRYSGIRGEIANLKRRFKAEYYYGIGQVFRKHLTDLEIVRKHARLHQMIMIHLLWMVCTSLVLIVSPPFLAVWFITTLITVGIVSIYAEKPIVSVWNIVSHIPATVGTIIGFIRYSPESDDNILQISINPIQITPTQPHELEN